MDPHSGSTPDAPRAGARLLHGGRLEAARARFPGAPQPFLDLSTGINPVPYPVVGIAPEEFSRLPEPEALARLEAAAARAYGLVEGGEAVAAAGTQGLIGLLPRLFAARDVAVLGPTYAEHAHAWAKAGAHVREVAAFDDLHGADAVVLCNPNNPDGRRVAPEDVAGLARRMGRRGGLLVVDEAFADLEEGRVSAAPLMPVDGLVILRSFGKTYGLAGLRLGFALCSPSIADRLRTVLGPWPVSGPALAVGARALADAGWRAAASARLAADSIRLDAMLEAAGFGVIGGTRLFRLASCADASAVGERLGYAGILVRVFPGLPGRMRFGIPGADADWHRLARALPAR